MFYKNFRTINFLFLSTARNDDDDDNNNEFAIDEKFKISLCFAMIFFYNNAVARCTDFFRLYNIAK